MSRLRPLALVVTLTLGATGWVAVPAVSFASAVPSPADSDVPDCLIACPEGEILYRVIVRDLAQNEIPGSFVKLDFLSCTTFPYCGPISGPYSIDTGNFTISRATDGAGVADFYLALRGTCGNILVNVYADGVLLNDVWLPVMDQNGDGAVGNDDVVIATGKIGGTDRTADFNCSNDITAADVSILATHNGHECPLPTPALRSSWGTLKIHYR